MGGRLEGRVALVTGAARGIGRGIALKFASEGARVGVMDLDEIACLGVVNEIILNGGDGIPLGGDISNPKQVEDAVKSVRLKFGPIDTLVNNAAIMPTGRLHETSLDDFEACVAVNLRGTFLVSKAVIPGMLELGKGAIINMASATGVRGLPGLAIYSATKGALIALTRCMSTDYAKKGIRTNAVAPGTIDSPMLEDFLAMQTNKDRLRKDFDAMHPIGRVGTIDEVANVCLFLASDDASFVTGSTYEVDGGLISKGEQPQD
ncbi:MAG: SDR family oxidoreductase [Pleurocapsa minor GSE-CHR-MK-17-07R]|jgi:NAD(P)-dependent dehydrogenase (short-subunit alcohol dehydrogenase family)|nr:SDR family oxidoreductase [Pleurocapsa minor GSE-CHR-MK 17-07R]